MNKKVIAVNRKARHEYHVLDTFEAGMVLMGSEVKSIREHKVSLVDGYIKVREGELFLVGSHIGAYSHSGYGGHPERRDRKLLLNRREIKKITKGSQEKGYTLVPLSLYYKNGWTKLKFGLIKGRQLHEKRKTIADREAKLSMDRLNKQQHQL